MNHQKAIAHQRLRRGFRVSKHIRGTSERPRLCVFRTHRHIYAQVIDDTAGRTLVSASTSDKQLRESVKYGGNKGAAEAVGKAVAERAVAAGVTKVCFDRRSFQYHGRVAALADAARKSGLSF
ncbi:MAG TPA: 50S ribosomal protein L18 [Pirellulales bacterium]|jgi:large subunit ribosomal protein L18|nr:50S ribosomal protein L18 [Pirellulales bacterium]